MIIVDNPDKIMQQGWLEYDSLLWNAIQKDEIVLLVEDWEGVVCEFMKYFVELILGGFWIAEEKQIV